MPSTSYTKQQWANNDPTKPLSATRLAHLEGQADAAVDDALEQVADQIGAVGTPVGDKLNLTIGEEIAAAIPEVNVKDFGATGNGTTDDSAAIQAAIDSLNTDFGGGVGTPIGGTVKFPPGRYACVTGLVVPRSVRLVGLGGMGAYESKSDTIGSVILAVTAGMTLLKTDGGTTPIQQGPQFENLCFADVSTSPKSVTLVHMRQVNRWRFRNCTFMNALVGIRGDAASSVHGGGDASWMAVEQCVFYSCATGYLGADGSSGTIIGGDWTNCDIGIDLDGRAAPMRILGVKMDVLDAGIGIRVRGYNNQIIASDFEMHGSAVGVLFDGDAALYPAPPAGHGNVIIASGFVGHPVSSVLPTGVRVTALARETQIAMNRYSNLATSVQNLGTNTRFVAFGQGVFGDPAATQIFLGPAGTTTARVEAGGASANAALDLRSKGTQPVYVSPNGTTVITVSSGGVSIADGLAISAGTGVGLKISGAADQKLGFYGKTPVAQPASTPAAATDLATAIALVNDMRTKLISLGLIA